MNLCVCYFDYCCGFFYLCPLVLNLIENNDFKSTCMLII